MKYNYQIFNNVATKEEFLSNIKTAATANGWVCDKDDINANSELYLHSTGNGNQNLYYSMKIKPQHIIGNYLALYSFGNTGFNSGSAVNAQPGKYTYGDLSEYYVNNLIFFPLMKQYVLVNTQMVLVFMDLVPPYGGLSGQRAVFHLVFGAIDSYKDIETEGNILLQYGYSMCSSHWCNDNMRNWYNSSLLGYCVFKEGEYPYFYRGLLYNGENKFTEDLGISVYKTLQSVEIYFGIKGYHYTDAVQYNDWMSRTALIKPIVSIDHTDAENVYFYPIGELPYYACKVYPYSKAGEIITYGTKKFMTFPLLRYTDGDGVAVEINE